MGANVSWKGVRFSDVLKITSGLAVIWALPSETAEEDVCNRAGESYRKESPEESYRI